MTMPGEIESKPRRKSGLQAVIAAATAIAGLALVINPESGVARAITIALPQIGDALPPLVAGVGTVVAAFSQPPKLTRKEERK